MLEAIFGDEYALLPHGDGVRLAASVALCLDEEAAERTVVVFEFRCPAVAATSEQGAEEDEQGGSVGVCFPIVALARNSGAGGGLRPTQLHALQLLLAEELQRRWESALVEEEQLAELLSGATDTLDEPPLSLSSICMWVQDGGARCVLAAAAPAPSRPPSRPRAYATKERAPAAATAKAAPPSPLPKRVPPGEGAEAKPSVFFCLFCLLTILFCLLYSFVCTPGEGGGAQSKPQRRGAKSAARGGGRRHGAQRGPRRVRQRSAAERGTASTNLRKAEKRKQGSAAYLKMMKCRKKLPAWQYRSKIVAQVGANEVVPVAGETGCGKTTQVPQFILDDAIARGVGGNLQMICTQPRRLAAMGVANRVAEERCERPGGAIGYAMRGEKKFSATDTRLLFCTTGVLLRRLGSDTAAEGLTHIFVDEVHERNVDTDFLLIILRDILRAGRRNRRNSPCALPLRVILMSATMDAERFADFFSRSGQPRCPVFEIPGRTFPVDASFLANVLEQTGYRPPQRSLQKRSKPRGGGGGVGVAHADDGGAAAAAFASIRGGGGGGAGSDGGPSAQAKDIASRYDYSRIDHDLVAAAVQYAADSEKRTYCDGAAGAVLVFVSGLDDIRKVERAIESHRRWVEGGSDGGGAHAELHVLPLHGQLSPEQQKRVFQHPPRGKIKVVISTNVAETSITIGEFLLFTVTFYANLAHSLTRSP